MSSIHQQAVPQNLILVLSKAGIRIKKYKSSVSFEKDLIKFLKRNNVLHLGTSSGDTNRVTPLEYKCDGLTLYILSEGGDKFNNLKKNRDVSFSIAEFYDADADFFGSKGLQGWGKARVYSRKKNPARFAELLVKMRTVHRLKKMGRKDLPPDFNYRIIEIRPDKMKYRNKREGVFNITWKRQ